MESYQSQQTIAVILYDYALPLDIAGPTDAFSGANQYWRTVNKLPSDYQYYRCHFIGVDNSVIKTKSGIKITADALISETNPKDYDVLLVPGGDGIYKTLGNDQLIKWVQTTHKHNKRTLSVCSGAALLAEAGILDGKKACSHWFVCKALQQKYPRVTFDAASLYISDGKITTSAGVTSGIDMALAVIEADMGRKAALEVARHLVVHVKRSGNQQQFSGPLKAQLSSKGTKMDALVHWILTHLSDPLSVDKLADNIGMSARSFTRHFTTSIGETPAKFVEHARLENARLLLEEDRAISLQEAAVASGFSSTEHLTRAFERKFGIHPNHYRVSFNLS